jgi:hypothetical protein
MLTITPLKLRTKERHARTRLPTFMLQSVSSYIVFHSLILTIISLRLVFIPELKNADRRLQFLATSPSGHMQSETRILSRPVIRCSVAQDIHQHLQTLTKKASQERIDKRQTERIAFVLVLFSDDMPALIKEIRVGHIASVIFTIV